MKMTSLIVLTAISLMASAQSQFTQPTRTYLMHSSGLHLKRGSDGIAKLEDASATKPQQVTFVPVGGGYYVVRADASRSYMALSGEWETHFVTDYTSDKMMTITLPTQSITTLLLPVGCKETGIRSMHGETEQSAKNTPKTIYSINGCRIGNSTKGLSPGLYIVRQGNTSRKIIIKN